MDNESLKKLIRLDAKVARLDSMYNEFRTLDLDIDLQSDQNLDNIMLIIGYGVYEKHNFLDIINRYEFEIYNILYERFELEHEMMDRYKGKLLITLRDENI